MLGLYGVRRRGYYIFVNNNTIAWIKNQFSYSHNFTFIMYKFIIDKYKQKWQESNFNKKCYIANSKISTKALDLILFWNNWNCWSDPKCFNNWCSSSSSKIPKDSFAMIRGISAPFSLLIHKLSHLPSFFFHFFPLSSLAPQWPSHTHPFHFLCLWNIFLEGLQYPQNLEKWLAFLILERSD